MAEKDSKKFGHAQLNNLVRLFLKYRLSAAGVSYLVKERSTRRRALRIALLLGTMTFMIYMTVNVIKEYRKYPKRIITDVTMQHNLEFPAVTFCGLSPIAMKNFEKTSVHKLQKNELYLTSKIMTKEVNMEELEQSCHENPLCSWSWVSSKCTCADSPCFTEQCIPSKYNGKCLCSSLMCNRTDLGSACTQSANTGCLCQVDFQYNWKRDDEEIDIPDELMEDITDIEQREFMRLVLGSKTDDFTDIFQDILPSMSEMFNYGASFDDMVASCSYEGISCDKRNFTVFIDPMFGKCYTFNYVGDDDKAQEKIIRTNNFGISSGLQIVLNSGTTGQLIKYLTPDIGHRVVVHNPRHVPFVTEHGFMVTTSTVTDIPVISAKTSRLKQPWGQCQENNKDLFSYDQLACKKDCYSSHMKQICDCVSRRFATISTASNHKDIELCSYKNVDQVACIKEVRDGIHNGSLSCDCLPACNEKDYLAYTYSSDINSQYFYTIRDMKTFLKEDGIITKAANDRISDSVFTGIKVFYKTLQEESSTEVICYSWDSLVANVGGNLGFFLGLTVLTFFEVTDFLWSIFSLVSNKKKK